MILIWGAMALNRRLSVSSGGWFRLAYLAAVGSNACSALRNLILATVLLKPRSGITDYLDVVGFVCAVAMIPLIVLGIVHKRRVAKRALLPTAAVHMSETWPPAPEEPV